MNFKKIFSIVLIAVTTFIAGCSKDDDTTTTTNTNIPPPASSALTAKINGTNWAPSADSSSAQLMNGEINITGVASNGQTITITLMDTIVGDYDLSQTGNGAGAYKPTLSASVSYTSNANPAWTSVQNYVHITSIDKANKKMTGTFAFKAVNLVTLDSVSITNGVFTNLPYVTSITSTGNNSFGVTIDGSAFSPSLISGFLTSGNIMITASDNTGAKSVGLTLPSNITTGTYNLVAFGTYDASYNPNSSTYLIVSTGSVTITEHNTVTKKLVGTFNFVATELAGPLTANLTNGSFTIFYQ